MAGIDFSTMTEAQLQQMYQQRQQEMAQAEAAAKEALAAGLQAINNPAQLPAGLNLAAQFEANSALLQGQTSSILGSLQQMTGGYANDLQAGWSALGMGMGMGPATTPMPMTANFGAPSAPWANPTSFFYQPVSWAQTAPAFQPFNTNFGGQSFAVEGAWNQSSFGMPQPMAMFAQGYHSAGPGYYLNGYMGC